MKRRILNLAVIILVCCLTAGCAVITEYMRKEHGRLKSAVEASAYVIIGTYGEKIPTDFNAEKFMQTVKGKIPQGYIDTLKHYSISVQPKGTYYLLTVRDPNSGKTVLFDFSCTPEADGLVYLYPGKYDTNNLDQYDPCKSK